MAKKDYYDVLGVSKDASKDEIKKAYKKMAMKYHPDRNKGDKESEEMFKEVGEAYSVLSDDNKRARYDRFGHEGLQGAAGGGGFGGFDFGDAESIFEQFFGGAFGGSRRRRSAGAPAGADIKISISLTLEEIAKETKKTIKIRKYNRCSKCSGSGAKSSSDVKKCSTCNGTGEIKQVQRSMFGQFVNVQACYDCEGTGKTIVNKCPLCGGEGRVKEEEKVIVSIPKGVSEGQYLTMQGKGNCGKRNGGYGDLIVIIKEADHKFFHRVDQNIYYDLKLSISQAALGAEVEVPTLEGKIKVNIAAGTQPNKKLRIKGKGLPYLNGYGQGDMFIRIAVWVPTSLSKETKSLFEKLAEFDETKPKPQEKGFFGKVKDFFHEL